ncbi:MAG TPA: hypothetical protein VNA20_15905 [Frankiaceae bacterium]|nr:hypothetical protein [Frankiaceae bacterium]
MRRRRPVLAAAAALALAAATGASAAPKKPALEVFFLIDATGDMVQARDAVRTAVDGIQARLAQRTTLRHGFGVFRDVTPNSLWLTDLYQRLSPVRANGGALPRDIAYQGGGDVPEAHTFALDAVIGVRHEPWTTEWSAAPAEFSGTLPKLVVLVTSAPAKQGMTYPALNETISRLRAAGVGVASLVVKTEQGDERGAREHLGSIAAGTAAVARSAFDCDGDRRVDVARGGPLVCPMPADPRVRQSFTGFADALVARYGR